MNPEIDDVMRLCSQIIETRIKAAVKTSVRGAMTSGGAFVGGLVGGPPGAFVGGALGVAAGWWMSEDLKPLPQIIMKMPLQEKQELFSNVMEVLGNLDWAEGAELISAVMGNFSLEAQVCAVIISFAKNNLGLKE